MPNFDNIKFFGLNNDGDSAVVRLLHSSVSTIERVPMHKIKVGDKYKSVKCNGDGCAICAKSGSAPTDRIFVHLYDYTDNTEKVWSRTDKIIPKFESLENDWGNLFNCVVRITRRGNEFPQYDVENLPPQKYAVVGTPDEKIAYRYYCTRSNDEIEEYYKTGVLPAHKKKEFVSKEEYAKQKKAKREGTKAEAPVAKSATTAPVVEDDELPFD